MRTLRSVYLAIALTAPLFGAQIEGASKPDSLLEVRGVVVEVGTLHGIAGIEMMLSAPGVRIQYTRTDSAGRFRFDVGEPGVYKVQPWRLDKAIGPPVASNSSSILGEKWMEKSVTLDNDHPIQDVRFEWARTSCISGLIVDDESGKPVSNLRIAALEAFWRDGRRHAAESAMGRTDDEGRFLLGGLAPGEYVIRPMISRPLKVLVRASESDIEATDRDYQDTFWPGGGGALATLHIAVSSGASVDIGELRLRKAARFRAHVSLKGVPCDAGQDLTIAVAKRQDYRMLSGRWDLYVGATVPCQDAVALASFESGDYLLTIGDIKGGFQLSAPFTVTGGPAR